MTLPFIFPLSNNKLLRRLSLNRNVFVVSKHFAQKYSMKGSFPCDHEKQFLKALHFLRFSLHLLP